MAELTAIMIGDVVGDPGLEVLEERLPSIIRENAADFVVVNGENAADRFGKTESVLARILAAGADVVSSGNHVWEKREFWPIMDTEQRVLRPANYPAGSAGRGWTWVEKDGVFWIIVNLQGRELMTPIDCPFKTFDAVMGSLPEQMDHALLNSDGLPAVTKPNFILVDFHAESTEEKEALAFYLDGRASLVAGTHTHVQTTDERILPKGTGYITDLGMTGPKDSVIGMDTKICLDRARTQVAYRMECAKSALKAVQGVIARFDGETGKTLSIERLT